jgi:hypothetical protein
MSRPYNRRPLAPGMYGMGQTAVSAERELPERRKDFFVYEAQAIGLAPNLTATDTVQIEADSIFVLQKLAFHAPAVAGTALATDAIGLVESQRILPNIGIQIVDTGSGRQLMQSPIPIPSLFGTGQLPFILPNPRLFMPTSVIQVNFTNLDGTNTYSVRLAFIGYKEYQTP